MKLGFIGTGNMASAIMGGIIKNQIIPANDIIGADVMEAGRKRVKEQFKIQVTADNHEVINSSDIVILSVKPQFYAEVISEIKDDVREDQIIITIAPGKTYYSNVVSNSYNSIVKSIDENNTSNDAKISKSIMNYSNEIGRAHV